MYNNKKAKGSIAFLFSTLLFSILKRDLARQFKIVGVFGFDSLFKCMLKPWSVFARA